ncbi:hemerythrin domain-containing protein [Pseudonocardia sp. ICBG162]|uniref:hemerythrin domain-containing protein n=1 Tax=Pseudonocardia sp. ICBG162 TaxID=2846761 RepID=UPI001CF62DCA|nr:hemerythrin domain-containing protein [Pseudonocardia sp. ICBG162]
MGPTTTTPDGAVDTRDMVVVHAALLREIRWAPAAVARATPGPARRRARTARHLRLVLDMLGHHHDGEDRLLLPLLRERAPRDALRTVEAREHEHAGIEDRLARVEQARGRWRAGDDDAAPALAAGLEALHDELAPHLRAEEREVLPLAGQYLSGSEWRAIGDAGVAAVPSSQLVTVFGMLMHDADPEVVRGMLAHAPGPARLLLPRIAPRAYARRRRAVHGPERS